MTAENIARFIHEISRLIGFAFRPEGAGLRQTEESRVQHRAGPGRRGRDRGISRERAFIWDFFAVLAASLFAVFLFTVFGGYSLLLWCQRSLLMVVPPAVVLAVLVWTFLKMDDKITALQKRVEELEAAQKNAEESEK